MYQKSLVCCTTSLKANITNVSFVNRVLAKYCLLHDLQYCNTFLSEILHLQYFFIIADFYCAIFQYFFNIALKYCNFSFAIFLKIFLKFLMNLSEIQCHNLQIQLLRSKLCKNTTIIFLKFLMQLAMPNYWVNNGFKTRFFYYRKILQK